MKIIESDWNHVNNNFPIYKSKVYILINDKEYVTTVSQLDIQRGEIGYMMVINDDLKWIASKLWRYHEDN